MALRKSDIIVLMEICKGAADRLTIASNMKTSINYITPIAKRLQEMRFVDITRQGKRISFRLSNAQHALSFKSMLIEEPGTAYPGFLYGLNFRIISYFFFSGKSFSDIALQLGISEKTVMNQSLPLR